MIIPQPYIKKRTGVQLYNAIEVMLVSFIFFFLIFNLIDTLSAMDETADTGIYSPYVWGFVEKKLHFSYTRNYFLPMVFRYSTLYICYIILHFVVVKNLAVKKAVVWNIVLVAVLYVSTVLIFGTTDTWLKSYLLYGNRSEASVYAILFAQNFVMAFYIYGGYMIYATIKYNPPKKLRDFSWLDLKKNPAIYDCMIIVLGSLITLTKPGIDVLLIAFFLFAIILYYYLYTILIPQIKRRKQSFAVYSLRAVGFIVILVFIVLGISKLCYPTKELTGKHFLISAGYFWILTHVAWFVYRYRAKKKGELTGLRTALNTSSANLDMLRSQINPHFLFNALNTLYGTALQENAARTGEGIQKLGDMMRFMLQENMQETISLTREIDYLQNYISLQKLRTQTSPDIVIQAEIDVQLNELRIVPMLLIPFIEDAFKHGISLREPSYIKIVLYTAGSTLYFDVQNTIHARPENDPEKYNNGIGMENVKQRLQLLYPEKHELSIRQTGKEFFVHLTLSL